MNERWGSVPGEERRTLARTFGELLRSRRLNLPLTVAELSRRAGISISHLYYLERGERRPRPSMLLSLANVLAPDDAANLAAEFEHAAGASLRPNTTRGERRRARREAAAAEQLPNLADQLEQQFSRARTRSPK
jgi:transcriptional regulator with XRE-family HTH domain